MREYKELLGLISDIEGQKASREVSYVPMDITAGDQLSTNPRSYSELVSEIPTPLFGGPQPQKPKKPQQQAQATVQVQQQRQAPPQQPPPKTIAPVPITPPATPKPEPKPFTMRPAPVPEESKPIQRVAPQPEAKQAVKVQEVQIPAPQKPLEVSAAEELKKVVSSSNISPQPQPQQAYEPTSKLVLPTLSLSDQVAELDRIIASLKSSAFDSSQMEIVKQEITGLSKLVSSQPQQGASSSGLDKDLADLRKIRLTEALSLIGGA